MTKRYFTFSFQTDDEQTRQNDLSDIGQCLAQLKIDDEQIQRTIDDLIEVKLVEKFFSSPFVSFRFEGKCSTASKFRRTINSDFIVVNSFVNS